ncbi:MAG: GNAT family N-acetyltransferase [Anaerolineae bacterium]|nr:GNAT family N-acetyltransferase [Anaerolineae bacterium]
MSTAHLTIRTAALADAELLHRTCWLELTLEFVELRLKDVLRRNARGLAWGVVVEIGGEPVAYGQLDRWGERGEICNLVVAEAYRGHGIGTALIDHFTEIAAGNGIRLLEIGAAASNPRALELYKRLGFVEDRRVRLNLDHGEETVIYLARRIA